MFDDYAKYQGLALRELIIQAERPIALEPFSKNGRVYAYAIDRRVGFFIKHSSKRLSPWQFTFRDLHIQQLSKLRQSYKARTKASGLRLA